MAKKIKLSELTNMFEGMDVEALEGVTIEGDIELDLGALGGGVDPMLAAALGQESAALAQHFARIAGMFGYPVGIGGPGMAATPEAALAAPKIKELLPSKFDVE
ncbi:MAG: acetyl-CoA synthase subunit delta, partial [Methanosarcinaceae archaeon]|nr:acetyl-CoA synthase subunit delta [Methanosarcinaceae archaeon]